MQDGISDHDTRAFSRSEQLNDLSRDLASRVLIELIRSVSPERTSEIAEVLLFPGLELSLTREVFSIVESGDHNPREFAIMVVLFAREPDPVAPSDLAYALGISIGVLRTQLRPLEQAGAVIHHHDPRRRRRTYVTLTHLGRIHISRTLVLFLADLEHVGRNLPPTAFMLLSHLCGVVRANASRHLSNARATVGKASGAETESSHRLRRLMRASSETTPTNVVRTVSVSHDSTGSQNGKSTPESGRHS